MNIKAIFPPGMTEITVNGLHQWDYGRKLEIRADDLPTIIEVHFSCRGMKDAVVRTCAVEDGAVEVTIPDLCLEQTSPITAWIYEIGETYGATAKTITLTVIPRTRPQSVVPPSADIPNKYTDALVAMNTSARVVGEELESATAEIHQTEEDAKTAIASAKEDAMDDMEAAVEAVLGGDVLVAAAKSLVSSRIFQASEEHAVEDVYIDAPGLYLVIFSFQGDWQNTTTSAVIGVYDLDKDVRTFGGFPTLGRVTADDGSLVVHVCYDHNEKALFAVSYTSLNPAYHPILEVYKLATFVDPTT